MWRPAGRKHISSADKALLCSLRFLNTVPMVRGALPAFAGAEVLCAGVELGSEDVVELPWARHRVRKRTLGKASQSVSVADSESAVSEPGGGGGLESGAVAV